MKNNLFLGFLILSSSTSLFCAQQALSPEAQALIAQARAIQVARNNDQVTLTLNGKSQIVTPGTNQTTGVFGKIMVGVTFRDIFRTTEVIKVNFFTKDTDGTMFPGFEQMTTEGYAVILEKTV